MNVGSLLMWLEKLHHQIVHLHHQTLCKEVTEVISETAQSSNAVRSVYQLLKRFLKTSENAGGPTQGNVCLEAGFTVDTPSPTVQYAVFQSQGLKMNTDMLSILLPS
jgi:hypothetical protein